MKNEEMRAEDILVKSPIKDKLKEREIALEAEREKMIPSGYIPVKLSSLGKLGLPEIVHVRDYTYEEALKMVELQDDKVSEGLINILNGIVFEDIDMGKAHVKDITEILLSVYGTWYSSVLETFRYYVNIDLKGEEREAKENISVATIPINSIKTVPIKDNVSLPINIGKGDFSVKLVLPRIENDVIAWKFAVKKHVRRENELSEIIKNVKKKKATDEEMKEYEEFISNRGKDFMRAMQAQLIHSLNGKELDTFAEKLEALSEIPLSVWTTYNQVVKENFSFGVQEEVDFVCSVTHETITRSFHFRPLHFIPVLDKKNDSRFEVSFG